MGSDRFRSDPIVGLIDLGQEILLPQRHRDLEQDSNKKIEVLESAEYEWKSVTKNGQQQTDDLFSSTINSILPLFSCLDKIRYC
ncbi:unnamed protein product [Rotaria magnacalcarata]|uniref:Uncharacterized protein n=1 Tax=Rotaria magnacalcarata TaxID=392030 RepID=A0A815EVZ1_9BILA|nr:unnamed protein product [Rotaria magnacalcarata]